MNSYVSHSQCKIRIKHPIFYEFTEQCAVQIDYGEQFLSVWFTVNVRQTRKCGYVFPTWFGRRHFDFSLWTMLLTCRPVTTAPPPPPPPPLGWANVALICHIGESFVLTNTTRNGVGVWELLPPTKWRHVLCGLTHSFMYSKTLTSFAGASSGNSSLKQRSAIGALSNHSF